MAKCKLHLLSSVTLYRVDSVINTDVNFIIVNLNRYGLIYFGVKTKNTVQVYKKIH